MRYTWTIALLVIALLVGGCETVKGVGRDMQKAGNWVEDTAK
jgi:predicted small secreted protein